MPRLSLSHLLVESDRLILGRSMGAFQPQKGDKIFYRYLESVLSSLLDVLPDVIFS